MATTPNIYVDPATNESKFDIIRDTTGNIEDKSWLNRYCKDANTEVPDNFSFANLDRTWFITAKWPTNINSFSIVAAKKVQLSLRVSRALKRKDILTSTLPNLNSPFHFNMNTILYHS